MFIPFRDTVTKQIKALLKGGIAFRVDVNKEELWEAYLRAFPEEDQQYNNCNTCKNFIRNFGCVGIIKNDKFVSVLDVKVSPKYQPSVDAMMAIINKRSVSGIYMTPEATYGQRDNISSAQSSNPGIQWHHFYVDVPAHLRTVLMGQTIQGQIAKYSTAYDLLKRACKELTPHSVELTLDLMDQNAIPRGDQYRKMVESFQSVQKDYSKAKDKNIYLWKCLSKSLFASGIRNSYIGTFLIDVSEGKDELQSLNALQAKEAGFMMSKFVVTPKQVEAFKKAIKEAGLEESMYRRHANANDIPANKTLYMHRSDHVIKDMFSDLATSQKINAKKLGAQEMTFDQFTKILPMISDIEMLVGNNHMTNFTSVTAPMYNSPNILSWNNQLAWTYSNDNASSKIKQAVKAQGGDVDGVIRISLAWSNSDDLDLHVREPNGNHIYYPNTGMIHSSSGMLDVDMNVGTGGSGNSSTNPVENVTYQNVDKIPQGTFEISVRNYTQRTHTNGGFTIEVEYDGEMHTFSFPTSPRNGQMKNIVTFNWSKANGLTIKGGTPQTQSKKKWGVHTNQFYRVDTIMNSPNHWDDTVGNKHVMFINKDFVNDENPRGFFNEQLKPEILKHHKNGFQVLGSKMRVAPTDDQISGLGFPTTQRNHIILKYRKDGIPQTSKVSF
jgi:hypothetical protein